MGIDWFTFSAQIVNFLILVGLLRRFLYGPVVRAMDEREAAIAERIGEADRRQQEADRLAAEYREKNERLEHQQEQRLAEVQAAARQRHQELLQEARESVDHTRTAWYEALDREQKALLRETSRETGLRAVQIARRALTDFANCDLHDQIVDVFLDRLNDMSQEQLQELRDTLSSESVPIVVTTAFPLSDAAESRVCRVLQEQLRADSNVVFRQTPELICGIEVRVGGQQISWSFADFLDSVGIGFEKELSAGVASPGASHSE